MQPIVAFADSFDPPLEEVADRRLPGFEPVVARHDRAVDDAADSGDVGDGIAGWRDGTVAGGRADDLDERARPDAGPDGAVMGVDAAHRDRNARLEAQRAGPFAGEPAGGPARRVRCVVKPVA